MLRSLKELEGYTVHATDGDVGHVENVYFDDEHWTVRFLVVNTGGWLTGRRVLISPIAIDEPLPDPQERRLQVRLTREQVRNSPDMDAEQPVSRQHELAHAGYYGWPVYWGGTGLWGGSMYPGMLFPAMAEEAVEPPAPPAEDAEEHDPHLRSGAEVIGYAVHATDGNIGHLDDLVIDDETWTIRYLAVDTSNWWPGGGVLVPRDRATGVSWIDREISFNLNREQIRDAPEWIPVVRVDRDYEERLIDYYGGYRYWEDPRLTRSAAPDAG